MSFKMFVFIHLRNFKKAFTALKDSAVVPPCGFFNYTLKIENYFLNLFVLLVIQFF